MKTSAEEIINYALFFSWMPYLAWRGWKNMKTKPRNSPADHRG